MKRKIVWSTLTFVLVLNLMIVVALTTTVSIKKLNDFDSEYISIYSVNNIRTDVVGLTSGNPVTTPISINV